MFSTIRKGAGISFRLRFRSRIHLSFVGGSRYSVKTHVGGPEGNNRTFKRSEPRSRLQRSYRSNWKNSERTHEQSAMVGPTDGLVESENTTDRSDASEFQARERTEFTFSLQLVVGSSYINL